MSSERDFNAERLESAFIGGDAESRHVSYQELEELANGKADAATRERLSLHFSECATCYAEFEDLKAFRAALQPAKRPRRIAVGVLAMAAAAALAVVAVRNPPKTAGHQTAPKLVASLKDGARTVGIDAQGVLYGLDGVRAEDRDLLREVLQRHALVVSPDVAGLKRGRDVLLGGGSEPVASSFRVTRPAGTVVSSNKPVFEWIVPAGGSDFVVSVYTTNFELVMTSPRLQSGIWTPDKPLPEGQTFVWTVSGMIGRRRVTVPHSPEPEARFRTPDAAARAEFEKALAAAPDSRLLEAVTAARLGMMDAAKDAVNGLNEANPGSPVVASLKAVLQ